MNMRKRLDRLEDAALHGQAVTVVILDEDTPEIRRSTEERMRREGRGCIVFGNKYDALI